MNLLEIIILAVGLCFDTFAVSLSSGICLPQIKRAEFLKITLTFAFIQSFLTLAGWLLGSGLESLISCVDHWIAFAVLFYIGGKMIWEAFSSAEDDKCIDIRNFKIMIAAGVATSIDALAVGVTLAVIDIPVARIFVTAMAIFLTTAIASAIGLKWGRKIGIKAGKRSEILGGIILVIIGVKILVEHLNILS
ncbi:MAG: manganese efflux pump MntP family protein [Bacteroidales bacterium]|nr:manganese efflux pump MntP family protein [Bacteroidales bacterium]